MQIFKNAEKNGGNDTRRYDLTLGQSNPPFRTRLNTLTAGMRARVRELLEFALPRS
jgi:hypothetical protein